MSEMIHYESGPQLATDIKNQTITLDGEPLDLNPAEAHVTRDLALFLSYMQGFEDFHGEVGLMQQRYFEFTNWLFASPFLAAMRQMAALHDHILFPYPVYGLVYGQSKAGKTSFLETMQKMMIGQKHKIGPQYFTRAGIDGVKRTAQGAPVIVDDVSQARFAQHAVDIIKNDDFGVSESLTQYPVIVICANEDVRTVAPEVIRRTILCRVQAGLKNTELMKNTVVRQTQHQTGTAFYRAYLGKMLSVLPVMLDTLESDDDVDAPDILAVSSGIICDLIRAFSREDRPHFVRELTLEDYFNEKVTGAYAIKTIRDAWKIDHKAFTISRNSNQLRYRAGDMWESGQIINELPEDLEAVRSNEWIIMNLKQACKFFGINFKIGRLGRVEEER